MFEKKCVGCHKKTEKDDRIIFRIMRLQHGDDEHSSSGGNYGPTFTYFIKTITRRKKIQIYMHYDCLEKYVWLIDKYSRQTAKFSDVEVEIRINGEKIEYQAIPRQNGWDFKTMLETIITRPAEVGTIFHEELLKELEKFVEHGIILAMFEKEDCLSIPIAMSNKNSLISDQISNQEYVEKCKVAKKEFLEERKRCEVIKGETDEIYLQAHIKFVFDCSIIIKYDAMKR